MTATCIMGNKMEFPVFFGGTDCQPLEEDAVRYPGA